MIFQVSNEYIKGSDVLKQSHKANSSLSTFIKKMYFSSIHLVCIDHYNPIEISDKVQHLQK